MQISTGSFTNGDAVLGAAVTAAPYPKIRLVRANSKWQEATPQNVNGFSALLFSFGLPLQKQLDVPVGLMLGAVGGTPSGYWLSEDALKSDAACQAAIKKHAATFNYDEAMQKCTAELEKWETAGEDPRWRSKDSQLVGFGYSGRIDRQKVGLLAAEACCAPLNVPTRRKAGYVTNCEGRTE